MLTSILTGKCKRRKRKSGNGNGIGKRKLEMVVIMLYVGHTVRAIVRHTCFVRCAFAIRCIYPSSSPSGVTFISSHVEVFDRYLFLLSMDSSKVRFIPS